MATLFENPRSIAIEGPIRAGKSTLAAMLAGSIGFHYLAEAQNNPFLTRFYQGESGAAFPVQMWFLTSRFELLQDASDRQMAGRQRNGRVADFLFEKNKIFACLNLTDDELALYDRQYRYFRDQLPTPDLVIYLQASPAALRKRIRRKGLPNEREISNGYLDRVVQAYEHFFFHYTASDLLVINTDDLDFVQNHRDFQMLLERMTAPVKGTQYFLPLRAGTGDRLHNQLGFGRSERPSLAARSTVPRTLSA